MKSWELAKAIAMNYFPSLCKSAILIHQDFKHYYTPWIHILQYRLRDLMRKRDEVIIGGTVSFEVINKIPFRRCVEATRFETVTEAEVQQVFKYSSKLVGETGKESIAAAHIMYYVHLGQRAKALQLVAAYEKKFKCETLDMKKAQDAIEQMTASENKRN